MSDLQTELGKSMACKLELLPAVSSSYLPMPRSTLLSPDLSCLKASRSTAYWPTTVTIVNLEASDDYIRKTRIS